MTHVKYKVLMELINTDWKRYFDSDAARKYLISLGIYNQDGTLHENYGGEIQGALCNVPEKSNE